MKSFKLASLATAAALCAAAPASAAIVVSISPATQTASVLGTVFVDIRISGLGNEILSAFDLNLLHNNALLSDATIVTFFDGEFGNVPSDSTFVGSPQAGVTELVGYSNLPDDDDVATTQTDDEFVFLRLSFSALAEGAAFLSWGNNPFFERNVTGRGAQSLNAQFEGACIAIGGATCNSVPEPASFSLVGLALLGAGVAGTTRRRRADAHRQTATI